MADNDEETSWVGLTAVFVGGPRDGVREAFAIERSIAEGADNRRFVYLVWPEGASEPTGHFIPDAIPHSSVRMIWHEFSPEESAQHARAAPRPARVRVPGRYEMVDYTRAVPMVLATGPAGKRGRITAVFVGGPTNGQSKELEVRVWPSDEPGIVRVSGFDVWPTTPREFVPGRYEPDTSAGGPLVPFIWREFTPDERAKRAEEIGYRETQPFD